MTKFLSAAALVGGTILALAFTTGAPTVAAAQGCGACYTWSDIGWCTVPCCKECHGCNRLTAEEPCE
jgi:hypothetical protein